MLPIPGELLETVGSSLKGVAACRGDRLPRVGCVCVCVNQEFRFQALTYAHAEPVSSFVKEGVRCADWLLAALMVCDPVIEDLEVLILFLPGFNEGDMNHCRASLLACSGFLHHHSPRKSKGKKQGTT